MRGTVLTWRFVTLVLAAVTVVTVVSSFLANIVPMLQAEGYATGRATAIAGLIGLGSLTGRLCGGLLLDRIDGRFVAAVAVLTPIATSLILLFVPQSAAVVSIGAFTLGLAAGVEWDAVAYLASRHFGVASFGTVFGTLTGLTLLLNGLGPTLTNYTYDVTRSYTFALWGFIPLCLVSCLMFLMLGPYPPDEGEGEQ
jgi:cyanate permease